MADRLIPMPKILPGDMDAGFDTYSQSIEVNLLAAGGLATSALFYLPDEQTIEIIDCGAMMTEQLADPDNICASGAFTFSILEEDGITSTTIGTGTVGRNNTAAGSAVAAVYSCARGNGADGAQGANFAWAAAFDTQAERRLNSRKVAPGSTAKGAIAVQVAVAAGAAALTAGKAVAFLRYKIVRSAYGEYHA